MNGSGSAGSARLLVASDEALVGETVCAALAARGFDAHLVAAATVGRDESSAAEAAGADVALLVTGLASYRDIRDAQTTVAQVDIPWLVVTTTPRGPAWGALFESGAALVVESSSEIVEIAALLESLVAGHDVADHRDAEDLQHQWEEMDQERSVLTARLAVLTPPELTILGLLYAGRTVSQVATALHISEAAADRKVRDLLAKLDLGSQLAAVERLGELLALDADAPPGGR